MSSTSHLKRYPAPKSWLIERKVGKHILRPNPGAHPKGHGMTLGLFLRQAGLAKTNKEVRRIVRGAEVLVDGKRVRDHHYQVGLFDVVAIPSIKFEKRIVLDTMHRLSTAPVKSKNKPVKIVAKHLLKKGKIQIACTSGRTLLTDKNQYALGDTLVLELPGQKVAEHTVLKKDAHVYLVGGSHAGEVGVVEEIKDGKVLYKLGNNSHETKKEYAFAVPEALAKELRA